MTAVRAITLHCDAYLNQRLVTCEYCRPVSISTNSLTEARQVAARDYRWTHYADRDYGPHHAGLGLSDPARTLLVNRIDAGPWHPTASADRNLARVLVALGYLERDTTTPGQPWTLTNLGRTVAVNLRDHLAAR